MKTVGIIPARMASSRFPGKPLAPICGIPMIGHVVMRCKLASSLDDVVVATCDEEIQSYITSLHGAAVMTSDLHERASDRTAEAVQKIEHETGEPVDIVVMIQGDEPLVTPELIDLLVEPMLRDSGLLIANLIAPVESDAEFHDPDVVKVVLDRRNFALYLSREAIPSQKKWSSEVPRYKQLGIIAFRRSFLLEFNSMEPTALEKIESVDMLRVLEHGKRLKCVHSPHSIYSVDTPRDLKMVETIMESDEFFPHYK